MSGEHQMGTYKRWKKTNRKCKKNENHYIDDWGCVDCMFEEVLRRWSSTDLVEGKEID